MTVDELHGRMVALEVIAMTAMGLYLANASNDPDMKLARGLLDHLRGQVEARTMGLSDEAAASARSYGDHLLSEALENLYLLCGKPKDVP